MKDVKAIEGWEIWQDPENGWLYVFFFIFRLNANPLPIPYHQQPRPVNRLNNGNMVMLPPNSPRKTIAGNKFGSEKAAKQQQQQFKNTGKIDPIGKCYKPNRYYRKPGSSLYIYIYILSVNQVLPVIGSRRTYNPSLSPSSDTTAPPTTSSSSVDTCLTSSLTTSAESSAEHPKSSTVSYRGRY